MSRLLLAAALVLTSACAWPLSLPGQNPHVQHTAARIADGVMVAQVALDQAGTLASALPLSTAQKDAVDCAILRVNGLDTPSATVLKVCGPVPSFTDSPTGRLLTALRGAVSKDACQLVKNYLTALGGANRLLEAAGVPLQTIRVAVAFAESYAGSCR